MYERPIKHTATLPVLRDPTTGNPFFKYLHRRSPESDRKNYNDRNRNNEITGWLNPKRIASGSGRRCVTTCIKPLYNGPSVRRDLP